MSRGASASRDTVLTRLVDWWEARRGSRDMPTRAELDPGELRRILPSLFMLDVVPEGGGTHRFRFRLTGTTVDEMVGMNLTGIDLHDALFGDRSAAIRAQYETAVRERRAVTCSHSVVVGNRYLEYDRVVVPLASDDGSRVVALLGAIAFSCAYSLSAGRPADCAREALSGSACDRPCFCVGADPLAVSASTWAPESAIRRRAP